MVGRQAELAHMPLWDVRRPPGKDQNCIRSPSGLSREDRSEPPVVG
jgi:hypothetical protein